MASIQTAPRNKNNPLQVKYLVVEQLHAGDPEKKVMVLKESPTTLDRDWILQGRTFAIRLSDMKVSVWNAGAKRLQWRKDARATKSFEGHLALSSRVLESHGYHPYR